MQIVLKEHKGVEGVGVLKRRGACGCATEEGREIVGEISRAGGGEEEGKAAGGEGRSVGGGDGEEGIGGERVSVRGFHLFDETTAANRANEIGGRWRVEGNRTIALVAKVKRRSDRATNTAGVAARGRHVALIEKEREFRQRG